MDISKTMPLSESKRKQWQTNTNVATLKYNIVQTCTMTNMT